MSRIIFSTINGTITREVVTSKASMYRSKVYLDDAINLLGFRRKLEHYTKTDDNDVFTEYFEVGYFLEMLHEGLPKAFDLLFMPDEHVELRSFDFDMIRKVADNFITRKLIKNLMTESNEAYERLYEDKDLSSEEENNEFVVQMFAYNKQNAYICLRNLMLIKSILKDGEYDVSKSNSQLLQAIVDGRFTKKAIEEGREKHLEDIDFLEKTSNVNSEADPDITDQLLLDIRNVEIIELNIARI